MIRVLWKQSQDNLQKQTYPRKEYLGKLLAWAQEVFIKMDASVEGSII
jgi:hypothetical protein